jgi:hypothetical protein
MGPSGNLSGGQRFLTLDTGKMIVRNCWNELPIPLAVIDRVNVLGRAERSLLVFTDHLGRVVGDYTPNVSKPGDKEASVVNDLYSSVPPVPSEMPGVFLVEEGSGDEIPGVDSPAVDVVTESTGVDMGVPQVDAVFDGAVFDMALYGGLKEQLNEPIAEMEAATPKVGMAARNARNRKKPATYAPSMQGNKYQVALAQATASLGTSKTSIAFAQMSVKLMSKGIH